MSWKKIEIRSNNFYRVIMTLESIYRNISLQGHFVSYLSVNSQKNKYRKKYRVTPINLSKIQLYNTIYKKYSLVKKIMMRYLIFWYRFSGMNKREEKFKHK